MNRPLVDLVEALDRLEQVLAMPLDDVIRDAAIKRFEICFELAWKSTQVRLRAHGLDCRSPRDCFELAYRQGWIDDAPWADLIRDRNLTTHTYDRELAQQVYSKLHGHLKAMQKLAASLSLE